MGRPSDPAHRADRVESHLGAGGRQATVDLQDEWLFLTITDDGIGGAGLAKGHGLAGLVERLKGVDASLSVNSPDGGPDQHRDDDSVHIPRAPIMLLSEYVVLSYATDLLASGEGFIGYLLKDRVADIDQFLDAVERHSQRIFTQAGVAPRRPGAPPGARRADADGSVSRAKADQPR